MSAPEIVEADGATWVEELAGEDLADFAEPAGVVAQKRLVDQVGGGRGVGDRGGRDPVLADFVEIAHRAL